MEICESAVYKFFLKRVYRPIIKTPRAEEGSINVSILQTKRVIDRGLDKWQGRVGKFKMSVPYWANRAQNVCIDVESLLVYNVCVISAVSKRVMLVGD